MDKDYLSLADFCRGIRRAIEVEDLRGWVCAELSQVQVSGGHYYLDLIQKAELSDLPVAKLRCTIWSRTAVRILPLFREATGGDLREGIKVLVYVSASFHEVFGLSGNITAIDPSYTLGDLEARRQAIIRQLHADGVIDMNKQLVLPRVIRRVAVVSAETAAGYGDFCNQLAGNPYNISFLPTLFPAIVQGAEAERSIVAALDAIALDFDSFDVVVIIRGGGSKMDLACFDSYNIALNISQFPLPIITGIGHERDVSIADVVAHTSVKTPTAVAEFLIRHDADFLASLDDYANRILLASSSRLASSSALLERLQLSLLGNAHRRLDRASARMEYLSTRATGSVVSHLRQCALKTEMLQNRLFTACRNNVAAQQRRIDHLQQQINTIDPRRVLARGFSVTANAHGVPLHSVSDVRTGSVIISYLSDGKIESVVGEKKEK